MPTARPRSTPRRPKKPPTWPGCCRPASRWRARRPTRSPSPERRCHEPRSRGAEQSPAGDPARRDSIRRPSRRRIRRRPGSGRLRRPGDGGGRGGVGGGRGRGGPGRGGAPGGRGGFVLGGRGARGQSPYQGSTNYTFGGSVLDTPPYQLRPDVPVTQPQFSKNNFGATFGGPVRIPGLYAEHEPAHELPAQLHRQPVEQPVRSVRDRADRCDAARRFLGERRSS